MVFAGEEGWSRGLLFEKFCQKLAIDFRQRLKIRQGNPLIDLMHGLADEAKLNHRADVFNEAGIGCPTSG